MFTICVMSSANTIFERLLIAAKAIKNIDSQAELARELNLPEQNITNWKSRGVPKIKIIELAEKWGFRTQWLNTGEGSMIDEPPPLFSRSSVKQERVEYNVDPINLEDNPDYPSIRRVNLRLSAGIVGFSIDHDIDDKSPIVMQRQWFESRGYNPSKLLATGVRGDSMSPGMNDGDTVVINTEDTTPVDGVAFAINYEGELTVKRLFRDAGIWWLSSDNPDQRKYPRKQCTGDLCLIIGRIVHKQSEVI